MKKKLFPFKTSDNKFFPPSDSIGKEPWIYHPW